jgi:hypothetical protein
MLLTGDGHVHSEWSQDTGGPRSAAAGRMEAMCRRALKIGLPALAITKHLDLTGLGYRPGGTTEKPAGLGGPISEDVGPTFEVGGLTRLVNLAHPCSTCVRLRSELS